MLAMAGRIAVQIARLAAETNLQNATMLTRRAIVAASRKETVGQFRRQFVVSAQDNCKVVGFHHGTLFAMRRLDVKNRAQPIAVFKVLRAK